MTFPSKKIESKMIVEEKIQPKSPLEKDSGELEEDDELEIPAFIRKKMKK